jgi:predicted hotdog family 3-hydroxylacyl-ACP dehydratase
VSAFLEKDLRVIEKDELWELVPHRGKMLLISRVLEYDVSGRTLRSEYDITRDCLFYDPALEGVPVWMCFEFMAQAVSALAGLTGKVRGTPPMMGLILSVSSLQIQVPLFRPGDIVGVQVREELRLEELQIDTVSTFSCAAFAGSVEAARAKLMVMDLEDPDRITKGCGGK